MSRRDELEEALAAWAGALFGPGRAGEIVPSLAERAGHLEQVERAALAHDEEPATSFRPYPLMEPGEET